MIQCMRPFLVSVFFASVLFITGAAHAVTIAYYRFEEGSGTNLIDSVDSSTDGTHNASYSSSVPIDPIPATGSANGSSLSFNDSAVATATSQPFILHNDFGDATLEFWLNVPSQPHSQVFWTRTGSTDNNRFNFHTNPGAVIGMDYRDPTGVLHNLFPSDGTITLTPNMWTHLAVTRTVDSPTAHTYRFYVDASLISTSVDTNPNLPTSSSWTISGELPFAGEIDEIRFSDQALAPSQLLVPEPSTFALAAVGLLSLAFWAWRSKRAGVKQMSESRTSDGPAGEVIYVAAVDEKKKINSHISCQLVPKLHNMLLLLAAVLLAASQAAAVEIVWTDTTTGQIRQGATDGSGPATELFGIADYPGSPSFVRPFGVTYNQGFLYWADFGTDQILRGAADGSGTVTELFGVADYPGSPSFIDPVDVAVDGGFIYWTDQSTDQLFRGAVDGSGSATLLFSGADYPGSPSDFRPEGLTVDGGFIYWADWSTGQILRGASDGSGSVTELFGIADYPGSPSGVNPREVVVDGGFVYCTDPTAFGGLGQILRGAADGSGSATELFNSADYPGSPSTIGPRGLAVDGGFIYWADFETNQILRGADDGSGAASELFGIADYPVSPPNDIQPNFVTLVPEPPSYIIALAGLALCFGLARCWWKRRRAAA